MTPLLNKTTIKTYILLSLLAALAVLIRLSENILPLQIEGIRPGLANTITIICLYLFGLRLSSLFLTIRILLVGILGTGLLTPGFLIGLSGAIISLFGMYLAQKSKVFSTYGVGIVGALTHNLGQLFMAAILMQSAALFSLLPILLLLSLPFGWLTGALAAKILPTCQRYLA